MRNRALNLKNPAWTEEDDKFLAEAYGDPEISIAEIAETLGRSEAAIRSRVFIKKNLRGKTVRRKPKVESVGVSNNNESVVIRLTKTDKNKVQAEIDFKGDFNNNDVLHIKAVEMMNKVGKAKTIYEI